jgi:hypothetical protein
MFRIVTLIVTWLMLLEIYIEKSTALSPWVCGSCKSHNSRRQICEGGREAACENAACEKAAWKEAAYREATCGEATCEDSWKTSCEETWAENCKGRREKGAANRPAKTESETKK